MPSAVGGGPLCRCPPSQKTAQGLRSELTFTDAAGRPVVIPKLPGTRTDGGLSIVSPSAHWRVGRLFSLYERAQTRHRTEKPPQDPLMAIREPRHCRLKIGGKPLPWGKVPGHRLFSTSFQAINRCRPRVDHLSRAFQKIAYQLVI